MSREYFSGTIREKFLQIFNSFRQLQFPLFDIMRKLDFNQSSTLTKIEAVEIIFYKEDGKQFVIEFSEFELSDIKDATKMKSEIRDLESEKRIIDKKIKELQDEIVLIENTE